MGGARSLSHVKTLVPKISSSGHDAEGDPPSSAPPDAGGGFQLASTVAALLMREKVVMSAATKSASPSLVGLYDASDVITCVARFWMESAAGATFIEMIVVTSPGMLEGSSWK